MVIQLRTALKKKSFFRYVVCKWNHITSIRSKLGSGHLKMKFLSISLNKFIYGNGYTLASPFPGLFHRRPSLQFSYYLPFLLCGERLSRNLPALTSQHIQIYECLLFYWDGHTIKKSISIYIFYWRDTLIFVITMTLRWWDVIFILAIRCYMRTVTLFFDDLTMYCIDGLTSVYI